MSDPETYGARREPGATFSVLGLRLPVRESVVIAVMTFTIIIDFYHDLALPQAPLLSQGIDRPLLYFIVPLATLLILGERPTDYGLRIGQWRMGVPLALGAIFVLTPVIIVAAGLPDFARFYRLDAYGEFSVAREHTGWAIAGFAADVISAEFLFRGFLMWTLVRLMGPAGVLMATIPFVFTHLGKPELETLTTLFGGLGFGWLAWRTQSIWYGAAIHAFILVLLLVIVNR